MIEIGQDALGGWAWMLFGTDARMIQSGQQCAMVEHAIDRAVEAWAEARIRGEPDVPARPHITFPDGA